MTKSDLRLLESIFSKEIMGGVYQGKSKRLIGLESDGYVQRVEFTLPGRVPIKVEGWALTHRGHITYCESCRGIDDDD